MVLTARVRVRPFQVKVVGVMPVDVAVFSSKMTTSTLAPAVTVNDLLMLVEVNGLMVIPTGASCSAIAARTDDGAKSAVAKTQRRNVTVNVRTQFIVISDERLRVTERIFFIRIGCTAWILTQLLLLVDDDVPRKFFMWIRKT